MPPFYLVVVLALAVAAPAARAQFQLPAPSAPGEKPRLQLPQRLIYSYGYGSESKLEYRRDVDLNKRLRDNSTFLAPQINGIFIYRPTDWLDATLEMIAEKEFVDEPRVTTLPGGETRISPPRHLSLLVDQAFVALKPFGPQFELIGGRRNYEDERHWLYDTSMDVLGIGLRLGRMRIEAFGGREVLWDLDFAPNTREVRDRVDTYLLSVDYRGLEDVRLGAYTLARHDRSPINAEGRPRLLGLRAQGLPYEWMSYWADLAWLRGEDELRRRFRGVGFDYGVTLRLTGWLLNPNFTIGYAAGSGDRNPDDNINREFRQSGLQSNETRFAGVSKFKIYGEALDPELSNLKILTVGLGARPVPTVSVDFVFHHYRLDEFADGLSALTTAEMNPFEPRRSKDVGRAFDVVVGLRSLFGLRRFGIDLRLGWFFPGDAFLRNDGTDEEPILRDADRSVGAVAKFWW